MVNVNPSKIAKAAKLSKLVKQEIVENAGYDFYGLRQVIKESGVVPGSYFHPSFVKKIGKRALSGEEIADKLRRTTSLGDIRKVKKRIKIDSEIRSGYQLSQVDLKKLDGLLKKDPGFYVPPGGVGGASIGNRYEEFIEFLNSPSYIRPAEIHLEEVKLLRGGSFVRANVQNGRHRMAVFRDMGIEGIPVAMSKESIEVAKKYNLLSDALY